MLLPVSSAEGRYQQISVSKGSAFSPLYLLSSRPYGQRCVVHMLLYWCSSCQLFQYLYLRLAGVTFMAIFCVFVWAMRYLSDVMAIAERVCVCVNVNVNAPPAREKYMCSEAVRRMIKRMAGMERPVLSAATDIDNGRRAQAACAPAVTVWVATCSAHSLAVAMGPA